MPRPLATMLEFPPPTPIPTQTVTAAAGCLGAAVRALPPEKLAPGALPAAIAAAAAADGARAPGGGCAELRAAAAAVRVVTSSCWSARLARAPPEDTLGGRADLIAVTAEPPAEPGVAGSPLVVPGGASVAAAGCAAVAADGAGRGLGLPVLSIAALLVAAAAGAASGFFVAASVLLVAGPELAGGARSMAPAAAPAFAGAGGAG